MKIEKLNENQIRCTLTKEDLASRQLKLSELAYGTEKAKRLFREMMQQANFQFGFEAEDIPLMIEAIPMNAECVVLLITKVEDPEELDTRFSHFSPSENDLEDENDFYDSEGDDMMDMLQQMQPQGSPEYGPIENIIPKEAVQYHSRMFFFRALSDVMDAAAQTGSACPCPNTLYKAPGGKGYLLTIYVGNAALDTFNRICNTLTEYGSIRRSPGTGHQNFLNEHCEILLHEDALQKLCQG